MFVVETCNIFLFMRYPVNMTFTSLVVSNFVNVRWILYVITALPVFHGYCLSIHVEISFVLLWTSVYPEPKGPVFACFLRPHYAISVGWANLLICLLYCLFSTLLISLYVLNFLITLITTLQARFCNLKIFEKCKKGFGYSLYLCYVSRI